MSRPEILRRVEDHGFVVFDSAADHDLNIIGLRNPNRSANSFDDLLFVCFKVDGQWIEHIFKCTTDAGLYHLHNPSRVAGTAIMIHPQQCRSVYKLDLHAGKYLALCQRNGRVMVWRDSNQDSWLDWYGEEVDGYGINIHRASESRLVDDVNRYSAGCTVIQDPDDFDLFIECCKMQVSYNGWNTFTYTLLLGDEGDFE